MKTDYKFCPVCGIALSSGFIEGKERQYCPGCQFVNYENPLPVAVAVTVKDGKFLLIKRGIPPRKGMWASPSGFIETGETAEEACLRELKEETGLDITRFIKISQPVYSSAGMTDESVAMVYVECTGQLSVEESTDSEEIEVMLVSRLQTQELIQNPKLKFDAKAWLVLSNFAENGRI